MHIPDGYLSPSSCVALYAAASPFWYAAMERVKRGLQTRLVPLVSLLAAFSFVIMMFNLPLPGGTTGHAVGVGLAAVLLGPRAATLAISAALLVQALFFGDGGVTAFGANCFNVAIAGSFAAAGVYRLAAGRTPLTARRRVVAAGAAGYAGINLSALLAAVELGLQPALFHDGDGTPLYAPYPLRIAIPAMMIGHLTLAGLAELVISAGVVAYLQRSDPSLLAFGAAVTTDRREDEPASLWWKTRFLWAGLAVLMVLTPLGLVVAGVAWGEWSAASLADPAARAEIAAVSGAALPDRAPSGLARLSSIWTAPFAGYAPPFSHAPAIGYVLSATFGGGLLLLAFSLAGWLAERRSRAPR